MIAKSFIVITILIIGQFLVSCGEKESNSKVKSEEPLQYEILKEEIIDIPGKTQIISTILIKEQDVITKKNVQKLLIDLFEERIAKTGFDYRDNPNSVAIYAYLTKERAEAEAGQWIGMIAKMPLDAKYEMTFNELGEDSMTEKKEERWNLNYDVRKEIWSKIINAERESQAEADKTFPMVLGVNKANMVKNGELSEKWQKDKENKIMKVYNISKTTLDSIALEGLLNDWAMPEFK